MPIKNFSQRALWLIHSIRIRKFSVDSSAFKILLFVCGILLLTVGLSSSGTSQDLGLQIEYNDERFSAASNAILSYLEGSFGALIMVVAGLIAIISAAFGQYRAAISCLVIAVGAFVLRSFVSTFFNDSNIMD